MQIYLCEKPDQAKDLAKILGVNQRASGYLHDGKQTTITWAFGHLLEQYMPEQYDPALKAWALESLPIVPSVWRSSVRESAKKQYKIVESLVKKATTVVISTDFDREGEAIARSLLERIGFTGTVQRLCLTALDDASIRKALQNVRDGHSTLPLYHAALSRQRADWLVGMNISRLYTVLARQSGFQETLHIGRVLTPTIALVCQRDKEIQAFKSLPYWTVTANIKAANGTFSAQWLVPESHADAQGRCVAKTAAQACANSALGQAVVTQVIHEDGAEAAPLPFDLTSLQQYASRRWGYTAQQVLDGAQALYEKHKAATYPRTECRYLPESQQQDVPDIFEALQENDPRIAPLVNAADSSTSAKRRVFNDAKITAHHAIIPTPGKTDISAMSAIELNLYDAIRRFFLAQFYPDHLYHDTKIVVSCSSERFEARGRTPIQAGWKAIFGSEQEADPQDSDEAPDDAPMVQASLPHLQENEAVQIIGQDIQEKVTRPPARFTEASLLAAMKNISRFVVEEKFKKVLRDTAGLGTSATRAGIIEGAVAKGYFQRKKRQLIATAKAQALIAVLPPGIKSPGMTAAWEQELEKIATGQSQPEKFDQSISTWLTQTVSQLKALAPTLTTTDGPFSKAFSAAQPHQVDCPACSSGKLRRLKSKYGFFWGCNNQECKKIFKDSSGGPVLDASGDEDSPACPECGSPMRLRSTKATSDKPRKKFWGCSDYPNCKGIEPHRPRRVR